MAMYEVAIHFFGRKTVKNGPCAGLLNWPEHQWEVLTRRPIGIKRAMALADEQGQRAVVTEWMTSNTVYDNGKEPGLPEGWHPAGEDWRR
jgi:hypothetical protein